MKVKVIFDNENQRYKIYNGDTVINATEVTINEIPIDKQLSDTSANAVENRAVKKALDDNKSYSQEIVGSLNEKVDANKSDSDNKVSTLRTDTELGLNALNSRIDEVIGQGMRLIKGTDFSWTWTVSVGNSSNFQLPADTVVFIAIPKGCEVQVLLNNVSVYGFGDISATDTQVGTFVTGSEITASDNFSLYVNVNSENIKELVEADTTLLIADSPQELKDIRVDFLGNTHETAGDSVRSIKEYIDKSVDGILGTVDDTINENITTPAVTTATGTNKVFTIDVSTLTENRRKATINANITPTVYPENLTKYGLVIRGKKEGGGLTTIGSFYSFPINFTIPSDVVEIYSLIAYGHDTLENDYTETFNCDVKVYNDTVENSENMAIRCDHLATLLVSHDVSYPSIDTVNKTLTLKRDTLIMLRYAPYYKKLNNTDIVISYADVFQNTSAIKIAYDLSKDVFIARKYNDKLEYNEVLICTIRDVSNKCLVSMSCPYYIDNMLFGVVESETFKADYNKNIKSINHRGYNKVAPENTLPAFKLSKKMGFNMVETDVRFTSDDVPVLLHDPSINRTARNSDGTEITGTVNIKDITYEEALTYDFGIKVSSSYAGTPIPKFEDFLILCRNLGLHAYIELKTSTIAQSQVLVNMVKNCGMQDKVTWISGSKNLLGYIKNIDSKARLGYVAYSVDATLIEDMQALKTVDNEVFIDITIGAVTSEYITLCKNANIPMETWGALTVNSILNADPYCTGFTTDSIIAGYELYNNNK